MKSLSAHEIKKPRNRRLRKKLRIAEFREFGIDIRIVFCKKVISFDAALDLWIDFVESKGWAFAGGGNEGGESFLALFATLGGAHLMSQILWQFKSGQKTRLDKKRNAESARCMALKLTIR